MLKVLLIDFILLFIVACSSLNSVKTDVSTLYKKQMKVRVNGVWYEGTASVPYSDKHNLYIKANGKLDFLLIRSCSRNIGDKSASNVKKWFFKKKKQAKISYSPNKIEKHFCGVYLEALEKGKGRHSFFYLLPDSKDTSGFETVATLYCDGKTENTVHNSICDAKEGLIQGIDFKNEMLVASSDNCIKSFDKKRGKSFEWVQHRGECLYLFSDEKGNKHRLITFGHDEVL